MCTPASRRRMSSPMLLPPMQQCACGGEQREVEQSRQLRGAWRGTHGQQGGGWRAGHLPHRRAGMAGGCDNRHVQPEHASQPASKHAGGRVGGRAGGRAGCIKRPHLHRHVVANGQHVGGGLRGQLARGRQDQRLHPAGAHGGRRRRTQVSAEAAHAAVAALMPTSMQQGIAADRQSAADSQSRCQVSLEHSARATAYGVPCSQAGRPSRAG